MAKERSTREKNDVGKSLPKAREMEKVLLLCTDGGTRRACLLGG
jgi:hypothetical protein